MRKQTAIAIAVALCFAAAGAAQAAPSSPAQVQGRKAKPPASKPATLQTITVTGSLIPQAELANANPVATVGQAEIKATGAVTLGQLMRSLPAMTGGAANPQDHTSSGGNTFGRQRLSLRGLGAKRTLILVDGHRVVSEDVNSIPASMIARVEVLKNGAAVVYGSDAIGGVVNFITKKAFNGVELTGQFGESSHSDGRTSGYTLTFGHTDTKSSLIMGVGHSKVDGILESARSWSASPIQLKGRPNGQVEAFPSGSDNSAFGDIQIPQSGPIHDFYTGCPSGGLAIKEGTSGLNPFTDYHCYVASGPNNDNFNYATNTELTTPVQRTTAFLDGSYKLAPHTSIYLNSYYAKSDAFFQEAAQTYHTPGINISANNYWNPFGVDFGPDGNRFTGRTIALLRTSDNSLTVGQFNVGLRGAFTIFDNTWRWDVGLDYGHEHTLSTSSGAPNVDALYTGPSFLDSATGKVVCGTPSNVIANCNGEYNPFNMFSAASMAAQKAANVITHDTTLTTLKDWHANLSGSPFSLPSGPIEIGLGVSYRKQYFDSSIDAATTINPLTGSCEIPTACSLPEQGGFNVKSAFGEVQVPILHRRPFAYNLNVTFGDRYSRYNTFGGNNSRELKVDWRPIARVLVRGSVEDVFRAPNIDELFAPISFADPFLTQDPCTGYTGTPVDPACVNVPTNGKFVNNNVVNDVETAITSAGARLAGFPIKPESGRSYDFGVVYSPKWVPGLTASFDAWHIYLNNIITTIGISNLLTLCSQGATIYCPFIGRFPSGPQQGQLSTQTIEPVGNMGRLDVGGDDLDLTYSGLTTPIGRFDLTFNTTYLRYYNAATAPGVPTYHLAGHYLNVGSDEAAACPVEGPGQCLFPRIRANFMALWSRGRWSATWRINYIGKFRMGSPDPTQDTHPAGGALNGFFIDYGSTFYHNVTVSYRVPHAKSTVTFGVNNVFNKQPPMMYENNTDNANTDALDFDLVGRFYWLRWTFDM